MSFVVGLSLALIRAFVRLIAALAWLVVAVVTVTVQACAQVAVAAIDGRTQRVRDRNRTQRLTRPTLTLPPPDPATRVNPQTGELR